MNLKLRKAYLLVAVVTLILFVTGFLAYQFFVKKELTGSLFTQSPERKQEFRPVAEGPNLTPFPSDIAMLMPPPLDASDSAFERYRANIEYNAVATNRIALKNCVATPTVAKMIEGVKFTFENNDNEDHLVSVTTENTFTLKAGEKKEMIANFGKGLGIYTYGCDDLIHPVGVILIRKTL